jgi:TPP-dependent pyruvate/acetoin dehydrogenase alpha subunit
VLSEAEQDALREDVQRLVDDAAERAKQAPLPTMEEIRTYVYAA